MPPQLQALLQNRNVLIGIIAGVILIAVLLFMFAGGGGSGNPGEEKIKPEHVQLTEVEGMGKALEIQALLAKHNIGINLVQGDGAKVKLNFPTNTTMNERDQAVITLVHSGLMDRNVGLELFDHGDLTASREEKRIKLIRAQQGELQRLIRKIDPIQDATVALSMPKQTLFARDEEQMSASVMLTMNVGTRLTRDKVRAIINLVAGSIQGLDAQHISLTDTNGVTYNSILDGTAELDDKLREQDAYMQQKVTSQLNRLVGEGHFVVTVSTLLREAARETMRESYDPSQTAVANRQTFEENLNSAASGAASGGAVSALVPKTVQTGGSGSDSSKDYIRKGSEVTYLPTRTQSIETSLPGIIEDISIAVTIDRAHFPSHIPEAELKTLLANAASPKVQPTNVTIAMADFEHAKPETIGETMVGDEPALDLPFWLPWAAGSIAALLLLMVLLSMAGKGNVKPPREMEEMHRELYALKEVQSQQQAQLQASEQRNRQLLEEQRRQLESKPAPAVEAGQLKQTLEELKETVQSPDIDDDDLDMQIRTWIESS